MKNRRSVALQCGASHAVDASQQDLKAIVMSETAGLGADVAIMAIGLPALVNPSLELLRKRRSGQPLCRFLKRGYGRCGCQSYPLQRTGHYRCQCAKPGRL
ncbi:zinc-binding dehydrogenase [Pantoea ananatis]